VDEARVIIVGECYLCGRVFTFNPHRVPSYDPSLDDPSKRPGRQPICETCIERVNAARSARGLDPWPVYADSYEAISPAEL
jgi:hypothetical protein